MAKTPSKLTPGDPIYRLPYELPMLTKAASKGKPVQWSIKVVKEGDYGVIISSVGREGGKRNETRDVVKTGKNAGKANATSAVGQAMLEAKSKWEKKLKSKGYSEDGTGSGSFDKRLLMPMLAETYEKFDHAMVHATTVKRWMQPKWDGHRCLAHITADEVVLMSRGGEVIDTMPHVVKILQGLREHRLVAQWKKVIIDGELFDDKGDFEGLSGTIRGKAKDDERQQAQDEMSYHPYDMFIPISTMDDQPTGPMLMSYGERYKLLEEMVKDLNPKTIKLTPTLICGGHKSLIVFRDKCIAEHQEGCILRLDLPYHPSKRSKGLYKCKVWIENEFEVVDFQSGRGSHDNKATFICKMPDSDLTFKATAPGTHADKERYLKDGEKYVGKMLTVKYFCLTKRGVPKNPVSKAFRLPHE